MGDQGPAMPLTPRIGSNRHAVHLPRLRKVLAKGQECLEPLSRLNGKGRQLGRVRHIADQSLLDAEPLRYGPKNGFALTFRIQLGANDPTRCLHWWNESCLLCGQFGIDRSEWRPPMVDTCNVKSTCEGTLRLQLRCPRS